MARITKVFSSGTIGPVITYEFRGTLCARAKPAFVRQSKATKASANLFGRASRLSRLLREGLESVLPDPREKDVMYRLNNTLFRWLQADMPPPSLTTADPLSITSFEFNKESELSARLKLKPGVAWKPGKIVIKIPTLNPSESVKAPAHTKTVYWKFCIAGCSLTDSNDTWNAQATIEMPYINNREIQEQEIELPFKKRAKSLTVVALGLSFMTAKKAGLTTIADKQWLPCGVLAVNVG